MLSAGLMAAHAARAQAPSYQVREIRGGLYWLSDGAYNTIFLVSSKGVIAVDPLPTLGQRYLDAVASVTRQPITHIVYSHEHTDHIGGASLFPGRPAIIAQSETARVLARRRDPRRPLPSITFDERYVLRLGGQTLILEYKGPNHCPGNVFVYAPRQKVLMLVDVVYPGYAPYPDLGVAQDVPGYIEAHRRVLDFDFNDFVGGHVDHIGSRADVERSLEFVLDLKRTAEGAVADKSFPTFLMQRPGPASQSTWFAHDDYETDRIARCYDLMLPRWSARLAGVERSLRAHCRSMIVALAIQFPPERPGPAGDTGADRPADGARDASAGSAEDRQ
jgi:glyoxylase-like metal-dependent hydrolase (beta-lactamase superfamily II)